MTAPRLTLNVEHGIATLHLDNERKLNALTPELLDQLDGFLGQLERDHDLRALVMTTAGERAFCCGADINAWGDLPTFEFARNWVKDGHRVFDRLARLSVPTIAAMTGHAFGGGLELAGAFDLRVMSTSAEIALPEAAVGVVPGWSGTQRLATHFPPGVLNEMALLGVRLPAKRCLTFGFVAAVAEDVNAKAFDMAAALKTKAPRSLEVNKLMISAAYGENTSAVIEALGGGLIASTEDKTEGVAAFREKRSPDFTGS